MSIQLLNIGFGNMVSANRVMAIISPESAPIKRMVQDARDKGLLIDATYGRKTRAVLVMDKWSNCTICNSTRNRSTSTCAI